MQVNKIIYISSLLIVAIMAWFGCKKAYNPKIVGGTVSYLVVEGFINTGTDSTKFMLSRTVSLTSNTVSNGELGAIVNVEGSDNSSYPLQELGNGLYAAPPLGLDNSKQYRVRIKTTDGKEYLSDFSQAKPTPPIDSVGYSVLSTGIQIYVNTHDPSNNTRYYRWDYEETWEFHALYPSYFKSNGQKIIMRDPDSLDYYCFTGDASTSITLGTSAKLAQDVISQGPIIFIPSTSEKLEDRYSILLKQYALTADAYNYWANLKKNTEQIGSIFDAQPSEVQGNVHCLSDPSIPVVGYVTASSMQEKRIYVNGYQLPRWLATYPYTCPLDTNLYCYGAGCINQVAINLITVPNHTQPTTAITARGNALDTLGYFSTYRECEDCTIRGTTKAPAFWQE